MARTTPETDDRLPLDQPWVFGPVGLLAVDQAGRLTQFQSRIDAWIDRIGRPPLLLDRSNPGRLIVIEPLTWSQISLTFDPQIQVRTFLTSSDGTELAFVGAIDAEHGSKDRLFIVDLATGSVRTIFSEPERVDDRSDDPFGDGLELIAWKDTTLYLHTQASASSGFWSVDTSSTGDAPKIVHWMGDGRSWTIRPNSNLLANASELVNLQTGARQNFSDAMVGPAFSPDGTTLVYLTNPDHDGDTALTTYDLASGITTVLHTFPGQEGYVPLRHGDAPTAMPVWLPGDNTPIYTIVYVPSMR